MLRFRLFRIPIRIHYLFIIMCGLLAWNQFSGGREGLIYAAGWVILPIFTVIWHELGHAFSRKKHGAPSSEIALGDIKEGPFMGFCTGPGNFTKSQSLKISIAGPMYNLVAALLILPVHFTPLIDLPYVEGFWRILFLSNLIWGILNLIPILPMDGGRILTLLMSGRSPLLLHLTGLFISIMMVVLAAITHRYFAVLLFATVVYENWLLILKRNEERA